MKKILLATALLLAPVGAFTTILSFASAAQAATSLGDLSPMIAIVTDVQKIAATGDFAATATRITDWETAWDDAADKMRPLDKAALGNIDDASDAALDAVRATKPDAAAVTPALAALLAALNNPTGK